jgi:hypothetical protein
VKLRLHANALRLRLNQAEVAQFSKTGWLEEAVEFAHGARLAFGLESLSTLASPRAVYQHDTLRIQVPSSTANEWITTDRVGISAEQPLSNGKHVSILIEKDFKCIHSPNPDPQGYPNPMQAEAGSKME